jgi:hypothetical protein
MLDVSAKDANIAQASIAQAFDRQLQRRRDGLEQPLDLVIRATGWQQGLKARQGLIQPLAQVDHPLPLCVFARCGETQKTP